MREDHIFSKKNPSEYFKNSNTSDTLLRRVSEGKIIDYDFSQRSCMIEKVELKV